MQNAGMLDHPFTPDGAPVQNLLQLHDIAVVAVVLTQGSSSSKGAQLLLPGRWADRGLKQSARSSFKTVCVDYMYSLHIVKERVLRSASRGYIREGHMISLIMRRSRVSTWYLVPAGLRRLPDRKPSRNRHVWGPAEERAHAVDAARESMAKG
jgi:hypothetical protein